MKGIRVSERVLVVGDTHEGWLLTKIELVEPGASFGQYRFVFTRNNEVRGVRNNFRDGEKVSCSDGKGAVVEAPLELAVFGRRYIEVVECGRQTAQTGD